MVKTVKKIPILLIEDNPNLSQLIKNFLEKKEKTIVQAYEGNSGLEKAYSNKYNLILLDLGIPNIKGLSLLNKLRDSGNVTPCIIITGHDNPFEEIQCFKLGANLYHKKPLNLELLNVQIDRLLNHKKTLKILYMLDISINLKLRQVQRNNNLIPLTFTEYNFLLMLIESNGEITSRAKIISNILDYNKDIEYTSVDTMVSRIRAKLKKEGNKQVIETVIKQGYRINLSYLQNIKIIDINKPLEL